MSRRSRLHYTLTTIGYRASRMKARLPRSTCLLGDSLSFGAADRYKLPSHTTSRQNLPPQPRSLGSIRAIAFRSWLPPIGPIKDSHLQSLRHARRNFLRRLSSPPAVHQSVEDRCGHNSQLSCSASCCCATLVASNRATRCYWVAQVARNLWVPQAQEVVIERSSGNPSFESTAGLLLLRSTGCKQPVPSQAEDYCDFATSASGSNGL